MTLLDRALTKAYSRRSLVEQAQVEPQPSPTVKRGWVAKLRQPQQQTGSASLTPAPVISPPVIAEPAEAVLPATQNMPHPAESLLVNRSISRGPAIIRFDVGHGPSPVRTGVATTLATAWSWPAICDRLLNSAAGAGLQGVASLLRELLADRRQRTLAFTGPGREVGRTSLMLTIARLLSEIAALRIALVDLDFGHPGLASALGIASGPDLWKTVCREVPAGASLVTLVPERLSLLPLHERVNPLELTGERVASIRTLLGRLRDEFDLVLVDAGPWDSIASRSLLHGACVEACVSVARHSDSAAATSATESQRHPEIESLGVIETFVPPATRSAL
jgi:Mrp family chromosome partitioning ATPase